MFTSDCPSEPFSPGDKVSLYGPHPAAEPLRHALEVRIGDGLEARLQRPDLPFEITRLTLSSPAELGSFSADLVTEVLLSVPGILAPEWVTDRGVGVVDVPVARPTIVTETALVWQVTPALSVHHEGKSARLVLVAPPSPRRTAPGPASVDLTRTECTVLAVALASLRYWCLVLQDMRDPLVAQAVRKAMRHAWTARNAFQA